MDRTIGEARAVLAASTATLLAAWMNVPPVVRLELRGIVPELVTALDGHARADTDLARAKREYQAAMAAVTAAVNRAIAGEL